MIKPCDSEALLRSMGYDFESYREPPSEPELSNVRFDELVPGIKRLEGLYAYKHQVESLEAIEKGKNVILVAGTGSGKTEAWALAAIREGLRTLAVYPTLALSADQLRRLKEYFKDLGLPEAVVKADSRSVRKLGPSAFSTAKIVATNPAFLMQDLKRIAEGRGYLREFLHKADLLVFDELDFYGSHGTSVILGMIEIIATFAEKVPQVVLLTATLGNAEQVAKLLEDLTGRETVVITGKPFKVENRGYLVISKNLEKLWRKLKERSSEVLRKLPELREALMDYEVFKENVFAIVEALRSKGIKVPSPSMDYAEIVASYVTCDGEGLTLVFVPSIKQAEKLLSEVRQKLPPSLHDKVATHHYMVSKEKREEIEEKARRGELKVIISPKTLAQGIDIGHVVRVVHVGLPDTVREFKQREGRKGRRGDIAFTETIILPFRQWDKKMMKYGSKMLLEWAKMDLERLYVDTSNDWVRMFTGLWKAISGNILRHDEEELLERLGLYKDGKVTPEGKRVWRNLGFYEFGPPYGIPRFVLRGGKKERLEEVGRRDLVERFQPGSFDYSSDAVVVEVGEEGILEMPLGDATKSYRWAFEAVQQYYSIKSRWGETWTTPEKDYKFGKLTSKVELLVRPPKKGFGKLTEEPLHVKWVVESAKADIKKVGESYVPVYEREEIALDVKVYGSYEDYTYGYSYPIDQGWEEHEALAAMAYALAVLRVEESMDITEIAFTLKKGPSKEMVVWEVAASGLLKSLDWNEAAEKIKRHKHTKMTELIALMVDSTSVSEFLKKHSWTDLKDLAAQLTSEMGGKAFEALEKLKEMEVKDVEANYFLILDDKLLIERKGKREVRPLKGPRDLLPLVEVLREPSVTYMPERQLEKVLREHPLVYRAYLTAATRGTVKNLYTLLRKRLGAEASSLKVVADKLGIDVEKDEDYLEVLKELHRRL